MLNQPIGYNRDIHFEYPLINLKPDFELADFTGKVHLSRTPQGILTQGDFRGSIPSECVRCLKSFTQNLRAEFNELYAFNQRSATETGLILPEDANIDLEPVLREYMLIELPIRPLCSEDCKGLCAICGQNLNEELCEHQKQPDNTEL
jgi:uncharacterized protein